MKRAIISVFDKTGVVELAKELINLGWEIISTGGTAQVLREAGLEVIGISQVTDFPEILEGRVKTLHPKVHGGILAKDTKEHFQVLKELEISPISLVVVNLYPFQQVVAGEGVSLEEALENIDIGGPTMVRAAAKNFQRVAVVVNPSDYNRIIQETKEQGAVSLATRQKLAQAAFAHTAQYDVAINQYLTELSGDKDFPDNYFLSGEKVQSLRYGENPHQRAAFYAFNPRSKSTLAGAQQLQGKELSYNNLVDLQAAWNIVQEFQDSPCVTIIKHTNPCGTALGTTLSEAYDRAFAADSISAFGGIIGLNQVVDQETAKKIGQTFMEAVIAPGFSPEAREILSAKENLRLLQIAGISGEQEQWIEKISGGFLVQDIDYQELLSEDFQVVTEKQPTEEEYQEMLFAWKIVKHIKSNAIVITRDGQTIGVGAGQMNRVGAAKIALEQAQDKLQGAVLASDAFFPFRDTVDLAAQMGIQAIIQPGGSIRDQEVIDACNEQGLSMIFTGKRHFRH